ncbi:MAG: benzoate-CoA ligase family protein [Peptococcaceae bacterium]|nr:benzoate-CoA ligase family protein [Candidatus Syntrophopropionicum ammoniitolerans]
MDFSALDFPKKFNAAERFIDWNVEKGRGNKIAIFHRDEQITYQQVLENVNRTGNAFKSLGIEMENRILLLAYDCPEFIYAFFGAIKIGAVPVTSNTMLMPEDYKYLLNNSRARAIVVSEDFLPRIMEVKKELMFLQQIIVIGKPVAGTVGFYELIDSFSSECPVAPTSPDDAAFWVYTSGTTGLPKGVVHLHHDMSCSAECYARGILGINENDRTFSVARLFYAYGLGNGMFFPFYVGASTILEPDRPLPDRVFSVITKYKPTLFFGVPTSYNAMLQVPEAKDKYNLDSLRLAVSAGEALPGTVWRGWKEKFGVEILDGIGSSETLHIYISNRPEQSKPDCSGKIVPGYEARIVNADGNLLPTGEPGTLMIKGESTAACYWNEHEKTKDAFVGHWFNTGDIYYQDAEGYFVYAGRDDDMIKAGGIWVSPIEVETALMKHPAVLECGVIGSADAGGLIKPKAYVVFKDGFVVNDGLIDEVKLFVKNSIAPYKFPRFVEPVVELPKTATGKIQRFKLRQMDEKKKKEKALSTV